MNFLKHTFKLIFCIWVGGTFSNFATAQTVQSSDFQYKSLISETPGSLNRVELSEEIYMQVAEPQLQDLRVYNANDEVVPFAVLQLTGEFQKTQSESAVPFFPLVDFSDSETVSQWIVQHVADSEKTVYESRLKNLPTQNVMGFLVDARQIADPIESLQFQWDNALLNFTHQISIETSDDLENWRTLVPKATLAVFAHAGQNLLHDSVAIPASTYQFLRVTMRDVTQNEDLKLMFKEIKAHSSKTTWQQGALRKKTITPLAVQNDTVQELQFDLGGFFPIDSLDLVTTEQTYFYNLHLFSSDDQKNWRPEGLWPFYQIEAQGEVVKSKSVNRATRKRYWKVAFEPGSGKSADLKLQITYQPDTVLFLTQGKAPYHLAYGYKNLTASHFDMKSLLQNTKMEMQNISSATLADPVKQREVALDVQKIKDDKLLAEKNKKSRIMWAVMLAGVAFLGFMAYRLLLDMKKS